MELNITGILEKPKGLTEEQVQELLAPIKGTTFARMVTCTNVATAAAHRDKKIQKISVANVQVFSTSNDVSPYTNAVRKQSGNTEFQAQESHFEHMTPYSLVRNKKSGKPFLYVIYNGAKSQYVIDGEPATKEEVAQWLTPSGAKALLEPAEKVVNVSADVEHKVIVRTVGLDNIVELQVAGVVAGAE